MPANRGLESVNHTLHGNQDMWVVPKAWAVSMLKEDGELQEVFLWDSFFVSVAL